MNQWNDGWGIPPAPGIQPVPMPFQAQTRKAEVVRRTVTTTKYDPNGEITEVNEVVEEFGYPATVTF